MPGASSGRCSPSRAARSTRTASRSAGRSPRARFRAMIDSALGLDPEDMSEAAKAEAHPARPRRSLRHHLRRQDQGRGERRPALRRQEPARPCRAADRAGVAEGHGRRGRAGSPSRRATATGAAAGGAPTAPRRRRHRRGRSARRPAPPRRAAKPPGPPGSTADRRDRRRMAGAHHARGGEGDRRWLEGRGGSISQSAV